LAGTGPERNLEERLTEFRLTTRFATLRRNATAEGAAEMIALLGSPNLGTSRILTEGAIVELEALERVDRASVLRVSEHYSGVGEGLGRLERANSALVDNLSVARGLAASRAVPELDRLARSLDDQALVAFALELEEVARVVEPDQVGEFILDRLEDIRR